MLGSRSDYASVRSSFTWNVPTHFNIGVDVCDKWADDPDRLALMHRRRDGTRRDYTFSQIKRLSNRFANVMRRHGI
ncbi:MAG TPA: AMP-dependent synthetase, partial [Thalassospira sp.]|nr:AMP-dependent synthetase [Thalassospira sp.]